MPRKPKPQADKPSAVVEATPVASVPVPESPGFPIVAVGASAGGVQALQRLLGALATDTGMAFVLIAHLAPKHESALAEILARATRLPVQQIEVNVRIEPDHVYPSPP